MNIKFFTIPALDTAIAEQELNEFCHRHRVVHLDKHFVNNAENSYWSICVTWLETKGAVASLGKAPLRKPKIDYKEVLNDEDFQLFSQLRDLRKVLAEQEGTPVYNVFTNEQLAAIVQKTILTKTELLKLEGVGDARVSKYGEAFIKRLTELRAE